MMISTCSRRTDLDVLALVEDELLLGLPIAPRHEKCETPDPRGTDDSVALHALAKLRGRKYRKVMPLCRAIEQ